VWILEGLLAALGALVIGFVLVIIGMFVYAVIKTELEMRDEKKDEEGRRK